MSKHSNMKLNLMPRLNLILLILILNVTTAISQAVQPINVGQCNGYREYVETLNQFGPKNHPAISSLLQQIVWKSNDNIYVYGNDGLNNAASSSFWVYNLTINQWKCIQPKNLTANYGQKGVFNASNCPGTRINSINFIDNSGNLYLLAGGGYQINDLWKYDVTLQQWAWVSGYNNTSGVLGTLGSIGVASQNYFPASRLQAKPILASDGMVYIYGGSPTFTNGNDLRTNLWKYNPNTNEWTLLSNKTTVGQVIGQVGVENASNHPAAMSGYTSWFYNNSLWYYGGTSENTTDANAVQKRIWKFNLATQLWVCVKDPSSARGSFGQQQISDSNNTPPALIDMSNSTVLNNEAYFIGGYELGGNSMDMETYGLHNSLWKYNMATNEWTWMRGNITTNRPAFFGKKGVENSNNIPEAKRHVFLWNENGIIKTFGGRTNNRGNTIDIWNYSPTSNNFTWTDGRSLAFKPWTDFETRAYIEDEDVPSVFNITTPYSTITWGEKGSKLWYLAQYTTNSSGIFGAMWEYDVATCTNFKIKEQTDYVTTYGELGVAADSNIPPYRQNSCLWETNSKLYLMGGNYNGSFFNDFWVFDKATKQWTWLNGAKNNDIPYSQYGPIGLASTTNYPRSRTQAISWVDEDENLWLFSGSNNESYYLNDFWKFDTVNSTWTLMGGSQNNCTATAPYFVDNYPPFLTSATSWSAGSDLFFYGGTTLIKSATSNTLTTGVSADIWKYNIPSNTWSKVMGNRRKSNYANYGLKLYGFTSNMPGARSHYAHWTDNYGNLWIYGGNGRGEIGTADNDLFDVWKYDISLNMWIWMDGIKNPVYYYDTSLIANDYTFPNRVLSPSFTYKGNGKYYLQMADEINALWEFNLDSYSRDYNIIEGYARFDSGGDCDPTDIGVPNLKLKINNIADFQFYTNLDGFYKIYTPVLNNIIQQFGLVENDSFFSVTPASATVNFSGYNNVQLHDFCVSPAAGLNNDLEIIIIPLTNARPGVNNQYKLIYRNKGTSVLSGSIDFNYNENIQSYISSTIAPVTTTPGQVSWDYLNLTPFESRSGIITLSLNGPLATPPINSGDIINLTAQINPIPNDFTPNDNVFSLSQTVVNSFDPNDKTCLQGTLISDTMIGQYVTYMIRFENTGTDFAQNIVVTDVIDTNKFDIQSIETVDSSHPYRKLVSDGNLLSFYFENINLPFPPSALRYGYVVFKIKTKATLNPGDAFSNTANIYFDYNAPITTNTYVTTIQNLGINENEINPLVLYPNPVKEVVHFETTENITKIEVYDISGRIINVLGVTNNAANLNDLVTGTYILKIYTENKLLYTKIIKE